MCYARRQRSSWARIKLSNKLYILRCIAVRFVWAIYLSFLYFFRVVFSLVLTDFVFALAFCFVLLLSVVQLSSFNPLSLREPVYYITSLLPCQEVFQNFFKNFFKIFSKPFQNSFRKSLAFSCNSRADISPPLCAATRLFYHISLPLSIPFLKYFRFSVFLWPLSYSALLFCDIFITFDAFRQKENAITPLTLFTMTAERAYFNSY